MPWPKAAAGGNGCDGNCTVDTGENLDFLAAGEDILAMLPTITT